MGRVDTGAGAETMAAPLDSASGLPPGADRVVLAKRYEILAMLGAGAMGTVYRARDVDLDETVALKMLKRELADSEEMLERFKREVKLARRVTHRNVARTFDIGEHERDRFLTMEYIDGEMLGARVGRQGQLRLLDALAIGRELCLGLAAAHEAGVIHRDLKPENIIQARDGRVVITDFGIARAFDPGARGTAAGGLVGTPAYMAPEQVEGLTNLDARVDLYALGLILYEIVTGRLPWESPSPIALAAVRLIRPPPDPRSFGTPLPHDFVALVLKLLSRDRAERYGSAMETEQALASVAARMTGELAGPIIVDAPRAARRSLAVLPLVNHAGADDEYIAEVVVEDLVDLLSVVPDLRVRARGETARIAAGAEDAREAGRALGVDVVVEGSLRRVPDGVRITLRLLTVSDGFQLWAHRYVVATSGVLGVADEAATAISTALVVDRAPTPRRATDPMTEELYLRGRRRMNGWFGTGAELVASLRAAHARAPGDPRILGALAFGMARHVSNERADAASVTEARELADRALTMDPKQPEARAAIGILHLANNEGAAGIVELKRALASAPNNIYVLDSLGRLFGEVGRPEEAMTLLRRALAIDPEATRPRFGLARIGALLGETDLFLERLGPVPSVESELIPYFLSRARHILCHGDVSDVPVVRELVKISPMPPAPSKLFDGYLGLATGETSLARLEKMIEVEFAIANAPSARRGAFNAQLVCEAMCVLGEHERAIEAIVEGEVHTMLDFVWLDRLPLLDPLRGDPRFQKIHGHAAARAQRVLEAYDGVR